jgi:MFS family permease
VLLSGFCMMLQMAASNTLLQTLVDEDKRGRVMSYFTMCFMGLAPLGSLLAGSIASRWDAPTAVRLGGVACVTGAAVFAVALPRLRTLMRPIYERAGILPAVAVAIQSSTDLETPPE